jgi:hypothetical protein
VNFAQLRASAHTKPGVRETRHAPWVIIVRSLSCVKSPRLPCLALGVDPAAPGAGYQGRNRDVLGNPMSSGIRLGLWCLLITLACTACGSSHAPPNTAVVPGGAPLTLKSGSPAICGQLAHQAPVRSIGTSIVKLAETPSTSAAAASLKSAAGGLRSLAHTAPASLRHDLTATASALDRAGSRSGNAAAWLRKVSHSLTRLGKAVQNECHFPVG